MMHEYFRRCKRKTLQKDPQYKAEKIKQMLHPPAKVNLCTTVYSKHSFMRRTHNASANVNKNEEKNFDGKLPVP